MPLAAGALEALEREGFTTCSGVLDAARLAALVLELDAVPAHAGRAGRRLSPAAIPEAARRLPGGDDLGDFVEAALGGPARIVRAVLFDKSSGAAWRVGWHRDRVLPVRHARPGGGFAAFSTKDGLPHARAPRVVLERLLALRLHLDEARVEDGCLLVRPGSHRHELPPERDRTAQRAVEAAAGDALLMRPLLLHASERPQRETRRRVLHLDLAGPQELPAGQEWPEDSVDCAMESGR